MTRTATRQPNTTSKITQIQDHFRTQIRKGKLVAGDRLPPERELANTFGVNLLTINKAMAVLESQMLLDRQTSRGTYIHPDVSRGQIMIIFDTRHFAVPELAGFYHKLLEELTGTVKSQHMRPTHILGHGMTPEIFVDSLEPQSTIWRQSTGVLAMAGLESFEGQLQAMGVPSVTLTTYPNQGDHPVVMDMNGLALRAHRHLVSCGCHRIALVSHVAIRDRMFVADDGGWYSYRPNLIDQLIVDGNPMIDEHIISGCRSPRDGYQAMQRLWDLDQKPDGVIITDDNTAMGVGQAVCDLHIDTPNQLKLVTHATAGVKRDFPLDFTCCQFDLARICRGAIGLLYRLMLRERDADRLVIKAAICQGSTT